MVGQQFLWSPERLDGRSREAVWRSQQHIGAAARDGRDVGRLCSQLPYPLASVVRPPKGKQRHQPEQRRRGALWYDRRFGVGLRPRDADRDAVDAGGREHFLPPRREQQLQQVGAMR